MNRKIINIYYGLHDSIQNYLEQHEEIHGEQTFLVGCNEGVYLVEILVARYGEDDEITKTVYTTSQKIKCDNLCVISLEYINGNNGLVVVFDIVNKIDAETLKRFSENLHVII